MVKPLFLLVLVVLTLSGCIEAGSLGLPADTKNIDLSSFKTQILDLQSPTSTSDMGVPLKSLPGHYVRSGEHGSYTESFSLEGLPSTTIVWKVYRDPYAKEYKDVQKRLTGIEEMNVSSEVFKVTVVDEDDIFQLASHIGLYTFVAEAQDPEKIDSAEVYGTHEEVVTAVFEAGLKNALRYDLKSFE